MATIRDSQTIKIEVIDGVREEERDPRRQVKLTADDVLLPELLEDYKGREFRPESVTIVYFAYGEHDDDGPVFHFYDANVTGPMLLKGGKLGKSTGSVRYMRLRDGLDERQLEILGKYVVPDYLAPFVRSYDPLGDEHPFTAE